MKDVLNNYYFWATLSLFILGYLIILFSFPKKINFLSEILDMLFDLFFYVISLRFLFREESFFGNILSKIILIAVLFYFLSLLGIIF